MVAWTEAVISGNQNAKVDVRVLEQITEQLITNDCRVIEESLGIIASTPNPDTRASRERLVQDRISHLRTLIPYADKKQAKEIQKVIELLKTEGPKHVKELQTVTNYKSRSQFLKEIINPLIEKKIIYRDGNAKSPKALIKLT